MNLNFIKPDINLFNNLKFLRQIVNDDTIVAKEKKLFKIVSDQKKSVKLIKKLRKYINIKEKKIVDAYEQEYRNSRNKTLT